MKRNSIIIGGIGAAVLGVTSWFGNAAVKDKVPPTIAITSPVVGALVFGRTTVSMYASDNRGVIRVLLQEAGSPVCDLTSAAVKAKTWSCIWNSWLDTDEARPRTLLATAYDGAGNQASASLQVTSAPRIRILTSELPQAKCGQSYRAVVQMTGGIPGTIKWSMQTQLSWLRLSQQGDDAVLEGVVPSGDVYGNCAFAQAAPGLLLAQLEESVR